MGMRWAFVLGILAAASLAAEAGAQQKPLCQTGVELRPNALAVQAMLRGSNSGPLPVGLVILAPTPADKPLLVVVEFAGELAKTASDPGAVAAAPMAVRAPPTHHPGTRIDLRKGDVAVENWMAWGLGPPPEACLLDDTKCRSPLVFKPEAELANEAARYDAKAKWMLDIRRALLAGEAVEFSYLAAPPRTGHVEGSLQIASSDITAAAQQIPELVTKLRAAWDAGQCMVVVS